MAYIGLKQLDPTLTGSLQVSGSSGVTGSLNVSLTGSFGRVVATTLSGDGSGLINVFEGTTPSSSISTRLTTAESELGNTLISGSAQIATDISGSWTSARLTGGTISGSAQLPSGTISGSSQLPSGIISGSTQLPSGTVSGSSQLATDISGSWQGSIDISSDTNLVGGTNITLTGDTLNVDDAFLVNSGDDTTSGTITAGGFTTTATGSFGRLEADVLEANTLVISSSV